MKSFAPLLLDAYKLSHPDQFPPNTQYIYSNTTPRKSRIKGVDSIVVFGLQYLIKEYFIDVWGDWFALSKEDALAEIKRVTDKFLGENSVNIQRYAELHDLGYLPVKVKALPEGTLCPIGIPFMTIINTDPKFYWVTNMLETLTQTVIWQAITSATISHQYRKVLDKNAKETGDESFVDFQGHDFSMRGMSSVETGTISAAAHLLSFKGTDTVPSLLFLEKYYGANIENEFIGCSVSATEHAVMSCYGDVNEQETFRHLIEDVYPNGIVSIVSDTWNLWDVLNKIMPNLKEKILARDGKLVVRPDSGIPEDIVCGLDIPEITELTELVYEFNHNIKYFKYQNSFYEFNENEYNDSVREYGLEINQEFKTSNINDIIDRLGYVVRPAQLDKNKIKGVIELLWDEFGGTINEKGYKVLDPHVGCIYGDSITLDRAKEISRRLKNKGFATTNIVYGVGSFTFQHNTRDTFSIACKATWAQVNNEQHNLFKDPITDDGTKKSATGLLCVQNTNGKLTLKEKCTAEEENSGELVTIFENGQLIKEYSLEEIRNNLCQQKNNVDY